jgi:hypothetical protein
MIHNFDQWLNESNQSLKDELQQVLDNNSEGLDMDDARPIMDKLTKSYSSASDTIEDFFVLMVSLEGAYDELRNSGESEHTVQERIDEIEEEIETLLGSIK